MKRIIAAAVLCLCILLCGCQLALPEGEGEGRDRLIGCVVTTEHVDTLELEIGPGGSIDSTHKPIYAEYYEESHTSDTGETIHSANYRFSDIEGISCFTAAITEADGEIYNTMQSDEAVQEIKRELKSGDDGLYSISISGTVYVPEGTYMEFYLNPVYQSADGGVYMTGGQGLRADAGGEASLKLSESSTIEQRGETVEYNGSVEMRFKSRPVYTGLHLVELGADNSVLGRTEFSVSGLPESFSVQSDTVCIVQELFYTDSEGVEQVERSIISSGDTDKYAEVFVLSEGGCLVPEQIELLWEQAD